MPPDHPFVHPFSSNYPKAAAARRITKAKTATITTLIDGAGSSEQIEGQVQIFRITTELRSINDDDLEPERFEVPPDWFEAKAP